MNKIFVLATKGSVHAYYKSGVNGVHQMSSSPQWAMQFSSAYKARKVKLIIGDGYRVERYSKADTTYSRVPIRS